MKKYAIFIFLVISWSGSKAQNNHVYFDKIDVKSGLPEPSVRAMIQDDQGYMWLGTQNGLVRYDGYRYKVYNLGTAKLNSTLNTNVVSLLIDKNKTLWISTLENGIFRYDRQNDAFTQFLYPPQKVESLGDIEAVDSEGNLWGFFKNEKLYIMKFDVKTKNYDFYGKDKKEPYYVNAVSFINIQKLSNGIWIGSENGLYHYEGAGKSLRGYFTNTDTAKQKIYNPVYEAPSEPGVIWTNTAYRGNADLTITRFDIKNNTTADYKATDKSGSVLSANVNGIYEDKNKRLWFSTDSGLSKLDRKTGTFTNFAPVDTIKSPNKNQLSDIVDDNKGGFWLNSGVGLVHFNALTNHFERYRRQDGASGSINSTQFIYKMIDRAGDLWVGYAFAGANKQDKIKSAFQIIKQLPGKADSYPADPVHLEVLKNGDRLLNNSQAIYLWRNGTDNFQIIYHAEKGGIIYRFAAGNDGLVYIGTSDGFVVYNPVNKTIERYKTVPNDPQSIGSNYVGRVFQDHTGIIWLGMADDKGICSFDPGTKKFTRYPYLSNITKPHADNDKSGILDDNRILAIHEDRENELWVGTNNGGVNLFNRKTGKFSSYYNQRNKLMYCIDNIYGDKLGRLWVGTYLNGLFLFDTKKGFYTNHLTEQSGLSYNDAASINEDSRGRIWVLSQRALSRVDPATMTIKNFELEKILPEYDVSHISNILNRLPDGRFTILTKNALITFNPDDLDDDTHVPFVNLESIDHSDPQSNSKVASNKLTLGVKTIELPYNENRLQFNYVGIQFDDPAQNKYAFKLDNYDKQWVQAGATRSATYTNLSPGTYTFNVIAANSSGVWNYKGASITIIINSPWWFTWWAWLLYIVVFVWAVYAFIAYRSKHLIRANQVLEEKVGLRTVQLSEANKELNEQREEITTQRDQLAETVTELKATQTQLIQSEKMASLGELTAGIAHEIQNPLNFVNNFSEVSAELVDEMDEELNKGDIAEAKAIGISLKDNLEKIRHHGKRADFIVKGMLEHSRTNKGEKTLTDINILADEFLRLSYHGLRAKDKNFNSEMTTRFDTALPKMTIVQQDIGRVLLNFFNNAFYAVNQKKKIAGDDYKPMVTVSTKLFSTSSGQRGVMIVVADNGNGIPDAIKDKIMQPFFTTKPTGEGTGLGLSLSYDIVVKGHGGTITVNSQVNEFTEFIVTIPVA